MDGSEKGLSRLSANLSHLAASPASGNTEDRGAEIAKEHDTPVEKWGGGDADGGRGSEQLTGDAVDEGRTSKRRSWFEKCVPVFSCCVFVFVRE